MSGPCQFYPFFPYKERGIEDESLTVVYINGNLLTISKARISPLDYGFLFGFSLFETLRSYDGRLFHLDKHLVRLRSGARSLGMPEPPEDEEIEKAIRLTLQANNLRDARLRLTFSIGEGSLSPELDSCRQPVFMVAAAPFTPPGEDTYKRGYKIILSEHRRFSQSILSSIKSGNYLPSLLARQEARRKGAQEALLLNERGSISECSASNIFLVKDGKLITPDVKGGILPGITREEVLKIGFSPACLG